jgi:hypothetical protein
MGDGVCPPCACTRNSTGVRPNSATTAEKEYIRTRCESKAAAPAPPYRLCTNPPSLVGHTQHQCGHVICQDNVIKSRQNQKIT